jgi:hypothetical protein
MSHEKNTKPSVLTFPAGVYASGFWRAYWPTYQLNILDVIDLNTTISYLRDTVTYAKTDIVWLQRATSLEHAKYIHAIAAIRKKVGFRIIHDVDDVLVREDMPSYYGIKTKPDLYNGEAMKQIFSLCDEITVSTPFLKEYYLKKFGHNNITVIPNRIPYFWTGNYYDEEKRLEIYRKHKKRPRIVFAGSTSHMNAFGKKGNDDFTHVVEAIKSSVKEFKWVFFGCVPLEMGDECLSGDVEYHLIETMDTYHKKLASLEACMMIAPLANNVNNHGKSNIKFQEASAHGLPIACQDITPYKQCPIRFTSGEQMLDQIRRTLATEETFISSSRYARNKMEGYWLEQESNVGMYEELFNYPYQDKNRVRIHKHNAVKR